MQLRSASLYADFDYCVEKSEKLYIILHTLCLICHTALSAHSNDSFVFCAVDE